MITKEQITFKNVKAFIQGYYRYYMYTWFKTKLLREHIVSQYRTRLNSVDKKCLADGQCKLCGCAVPQLLWANKACDKPCYPPMMDKITWNKFFQNDDWILEVTKAGLIFKYKHKIIEPEEKNQKWIDKEEWDFYQNFMQSKQEEWVKAYNKQKTKEGELLYLVKFPGDSQDYWVNRELLRLYFKLKDREAAKILENKPTAYKEYEKEKSKEIFQRTICGTKIKGWENRETIEEIDKFSKQADKDFRKFMYNEDNNIKE